MSGRSGQQSREPFATYDPDSSCWRTSQPSLLLENLPEQSVIWPRSGMWDRGAAYPLPLSGQRTSANESSSLLPTPTATSYGNNQSPSAGAAVRPSLDTLAKLFPTPRASDTTGAGVHGTGGMDLRTAEALLVNPGPDHGPGPTAMTTDQPSDNGNESSADTPPGLLF